MTDVVAGERLSATWDGGPAPAITVAIATYNRAGFIPELLCALERQSLGAGRFEVVICDDGSNDDTWARLSAAVTSTALRLRVVRLSGSGRGPARARNVAFGRGRAPVVAFTDDDCIPTAGWLAGLLAAFDGADVVQGAVAAEPEAWSTAGPWTKTLWVTGMTPWFETANVAYRRTLLDAVGGFDENDGISRRPGGLAFGEDVLLGARAVAAGGRRAFVPDAVVHHRCLPGSYAEYLEARRREVGFPGLAKRSELVRDNLVAGVFLTRRRAAFDVAALGVVLALASRRLRWLLPAAAYVAVVWPEVDARSNALPFSRGRRLLQLAYADGVALTWLLRGSLRDRRLVL